MDGRQLPDRFLHDINLNLNDVILIVDFFVDEIKLKEPTHLATF